MTNPRQMGNQFGYWLGVEVEATPHYGLKTLFISRLSVVEEVLKAYPDYPHVFFCADGPEFIDCVLDHGSTSASLVAYSHQLLAQGKAITLQVTPKQAFDLLLTQLRVENDGNQLLCMLVTVELPFPGIGNWAIKAVPQTVFDSKRPYESGVYVATAAFTGFTPWSAYSDDVDGVELS